MDMFHDINAVGVGAKSTDAQNEPFRTESLGPGKPSGKPFLALNDEGYINRPPGDWAANIILSNNMRENELDAFSRARKGEIVRNE